MLAVKMSNRHVITAASFLLYISQILAETNTVNHLTCGSVVKLENQKYKQVRLHSHDIKYGSGSGQQSVTAAENHDSNSYWSILGEKDKPCNRGEPIECGQVIRLQHVQTRKYLHSHLFRSPLSSKQEVSAFGGDNESDTGDYWTVYCKTRYWQKDQAIRLKHRDTDMWLALSGLSYSRPINNQMEVVCTSPSDDLSYWTAAEGVYVQPTTKSPSQSMHDEL